MELDDVKKLIEQIGISFFIEDKNKIKVIDYVNEREEFNKKNLAKLDSYEKFCKFVSCLLIRNQSGTYEKDDQTFYKSSDLEGKLIALSRFNEKWDDEDFLEKIVEESKINYKRFRESASEILIQVKEIYEEKYKGDFSIYIKEAQTYFDKFKDKPLPKRYLLDQFVGINGIGNKTRDLGLSTLISNVISIDRHLMRIPHLLKISELSIIPEKKWEANSPGSKNNYFEFAKFLLNLSHQINITPYRFDRLFWIFATKVCIKKNPHCENCYVENCEKRNKN